MSSSINETKCLWFTWLGLYVLALHPSSLHNSGTCKLYDWNGFNPVRAAKRSSWRNLLPDISAAPFSSDKCSLSHLAADHKLRQCDLEKQLYKSHQLYMWWLQLLQLAVSKIPPSIIFLFWFVSSQKSITQVSFFFLDSISPQMNINHYHDINVGAELS